MPGGRRCGAWMDGRRRGNPPLHRLVTSSRNQSPRSKEGGLKGWVGGEGGGVGIQHPTSNTSPLVRVYLLVPSVVYVPGTYHTWYLVQFMVGRDRFVDVGCGLDVRQPRPTPNIYPGTEYLVPGTYAASTCGYVSVMYKYSSIYVRATRPGYSFRT